MPSSKNKDYAVEKVISKRIDGKGRTLYLIKWKGYSSSENTWEPENHVDNCQDLIKEFEAEQAKKNKSSSPTSKRSTRFGSSPTKNSTNKNGKSTRQHRKRESSTDSTSTDNENGNGYIEKKSNSKRLRKSTTDTETASSTNSYDSDILDTGKLEEILDARRNKKLDTVEYYIQVKKIKKAVWINSNRLTDDYSQEVIDFLEDKYV